jgi:alkaline phosphatase
LRRLLDKADFPTFLFEGQNTAPFVSEPDAFGNSMDFAVGWAGTSDVAGAIVSRAEGINADLLRSEFSTRFDSSDVYRMVYLTLFGELLPASYGTTAPDRAE